MSADPKQRLPRTVVGLGLVSLFTDASSEAIFPLLPAFLVSLGAPSWFIGLVEGTAELVASSLKYLTGLFADRLARLKPLVLLGYGLSAVVRPLVAFAVFPWQVLVIRAGDRVGKGVRTTPRDALIAAVTDPSMRARAYGFHRAMDNAGAALGTLIAIAVLLALGATGGATPEIADKLRTVFLWAAVPGAFAIVALALTPEPPRIPSAPGAVRAAEPLPPALKRALVALVLFAFANATDAFLLVKAAKLGASALLAPVLWFGLHVIKAATGTAGGRLADRYGKRRALVIGWCVYAALWGAIGFADTLPVLFVLSACYGVSHGLTEGAERGLIADLAAGKNKGKAFGAYNMLIGLTALASSTAFGAVWDRWGSAPAFVGSASFALVAALVLRFLVPESRPAAKGTC
jgi:MFS family permease